MTSPRYSFLFAGQSTPWQPVLAEHLPDPAIGPALATALADSDGVLHPVAAHITAIGAGQLSLEKLVQAADPVDPVNSVPGITLVHYGHILALRAAGFDSPVECIGHSQGALGAALMDHEPAHVISIARLIGAAASRAARTLNGVPMLAISGVKDAELHQIMADAESTAEIALKNGRTRFVISGTPQDLARVERAVADALQADENRRAEKLTGGAPLRITTEYLEVAAPFHHSMLEPAVAQVEQWAALCQLDAELASRLARAVLTDYVDWPAQVRQLEPVDVLIDLGPGAALGKLTKDIVEGSGVAVASATSLSDIDQLDLAPAAPDSPSAARPVDWSDFAPRRIELPDGTVAVDTAFTRLTGNSPIILAGMTPTTVDPEIVAAAANAGYWAELAGGGQVTAEVYAENLAGLKDQLEPGRTAKFNAMFMDRYLWNLQFGAQRIVGKSRESGAPIDGVVISAGIPELDEAPALIAELQGQGFRYVAFKPGTIAQIEQVLAIAAEVDTTVIMHVEDGHAGGHHSWENLDDLLLATYGDIRRHPNVILCVGGGIGTPERAADFISGEWSLVHDVPLMPVDAVLIGTAAMTALEAQTTEEVKDLLVDTEGVAPSDNGGFVGSGASRGGMTSGLSHLRADMYEIDNHAAACARLVAEVEGDMSRINARREEIIAALNKTAKPYFGDLEDMTYAQVVDRFVELSYPFVDPSWAQRFHELLQRFEARLSPQDHGQVPTMFPGLADVADAPAAAAALVQTHPSAQSLTLTTFDAAWFVDLCRKYPKPMGFVPVLDDDLLRAWGQDSLWQAQDARYPADAVRIIPGPVSVAGITSKNEPIADILGRFDAAVLHRLTSAAQLPAVSRLGAARTVEDLIRTLPFISWTGHVMDNPAFVTESSRCSVDIGEGTLGQDDVAATVTLHLDTLWDDSEADVHAVRTLVVPLLLPPSVLSGGLPIVDEDRLPTSMFNLLAGTAGVGNTGVTGDEIPALPTMTDSEHSPYGQAHWAFHLSKNLGADHAGVTGAALATEAIVPDALLGPCWPAIYAALGSAQVNDYPVIEGLLNAVHLDHTARFLRPVSDIPAGARIDVTSWAESVQESSSGRVVEVNLQLSLDGEDLGAFSERFAIRGRAFGTQPPAEPALAGGTGAQIEDTPRSTLARFTVTAPSDMTPFAWVSGDFNPIHTSQVAARVAGLEAPLVHGMWLSATAQHAVGQRLLGWTYRMFGLVALDAEVEIQVERVGRVRGGGHAVEVTCRIDGNLVSQASAITDVPATAYVYPGQGIQSPGMGLDERSVSRAVAEVWNRADAHTRTALGFSILSVVRDNPTELVAQGTRFKHPEGVLNLTQFTQVALATVAFAQTARLREAGALNRGAYFAGHSLGEYNALSAYDETIDLETVLELVFHRGSTMHNLVPRDAQGRSNYRMGALRPSQLGVAEEDVEAFIAQVSEETGEFLEIVNYNLAGQQYAVAGTVAGIAELERIGAPHKAFMRVPGIDVPFHSAVLHDGVPDFRDRLNELLPQQIDYQVLVGRYIPNLVARPFALTEEFATAILDVVPSEPIREALPEWSILAETERARLLLVELLCWQFASPVRWIETQALLFAELGVEEFIEVGLGNAPTLANLAAKTLDLSRFAGIHAHVRNVQRDEDVVYSQDVQQLAEAEPEPEPEPEAAEPTQTQPEPVPQAPAAPVTAAEELPYTASAAIRTLLAFANKLRADQIGNADTTDSLTNGVSSRLNQLLMDMSAELGLSSVEGAAEADVATLSATVDKAAFNYKPFGPVLGEAIKERIRKLFGPAGVKQSFIGDYLSSEWGLGAGWAAHVTAAILLGTREGDSTRGGELATLPLEAANQTQVKALIDEAVNQVGTDHGINVAKPQSGSAGGGTVDSAALDEFSTQLNEALGSTARHLLQSLGLETVASDITGDNTDAEVIEAVNTELGPNWPSLVAPSFDARRAVLIDDRWASAREDVTRIGTGEMSEANVASFRGTGEAVARHAEWWGPQSPLLQDIAAAARDTAPAGPVAVVTGMAPQSIAGGIVAGLLEQGATVVATASRISADRLAYAKQLYREHASGAAALWLVPANLSSYRDVDALVEWIGTEQLQTIGSEQVVTKEALVPDLYFPFAAPPVMGTVEDAGAAAENQARLLLWSVERSMTALSALGADIDVSHRLHVVLPGSPNRGTFGGDGAYGETKAAFDAIVNKWSVEPWAQRITLAHPRIGWVAGTGLMGGNDPLVTAAQEAGVHVWSPAEISQELLALCTAEARQQAAREPLAADLTGGLDGVSLSSLEAQVAPLQEEDVAEATATLNALPTPIQPTQVTTEWGQTSATLEDTVVIVGLGEVSAWGSGRTRLEAEYGIHCDGTVELTPAGVLELAWMTGLLSWKHTPKAGWYDQEDNLVDEAEIYTRFRDEVVARSGVRTFVDDAAITNPDGVPESPLAVEVFLDKDITFTVDSAESAHDLHAADPNFTRIAEVDGEWQVTRLAGARVRVPRRATLARKVGGQFPTNFDPTRWGIPADMVESLDRMAVWNLVTAVDAYLSAGFTPAEILEAVHPADVAMTQGTGFGGMTSMRKLFLDRFMEEDIPSDILQETLPNVVAAHTMQSFVGGYGSMIHPVGACATAAVSIEEGIDKIHCHKADFVVAGAIDDISVESITGFANMNATADSDVMAAKGINERFYSRANDRRRGGFVEAQGGGTVLLARGSVAAKLGLPVYGVVAFAQSYADGMHTSIPAPGLGALAAGRGAKDSRLSRRLAELGVSADDIAVISKHDTSTNANDPNESDLHTRLANALGRAPGNPLYIVSQKSLTGHAKGGAAVFQVAGLSDMFRTGRIPANAGLDCVDPAMATATHFVWPRTPLQLPAPIKAGLLTSLGFGHVSAVVALVHPGAFHAVISAELGESAAAQWHSRATARLRAGVKRREAGMLGNRPLFERDVQRPAKEDEAAMLLGELQ